MTSSESFACASTLLNNEVLEKNAPNPMESTSHLRVNTERNSTLPPSSLSPAYEGFANTLGTPREREETSWKSYMSRER